MQSVIPGQVGIQNIRTEPLDSHLRGNDSHGKNQSAAMVLVTS